MPTGGTYEGIVGVRVGRVKGVTVADGLGAGVEVGASDGLGVGVDEGVSDGLGQGVGVDDRTRSGAGVSALGIKGITV
jgi:hypothetical protein